MTDFTPAPWPDEIQDYFSEHSAIAWVPRFLHPLIEEFTVELAAMEPNFRYQDIQIWHDGSVRIRLADERAYDRPFIETATKTMSDQLTSIYRLLSQV